ncbi:unnamed protein product [Clonostachys rhizophaga]|uniref:Uncharacterized protein n=1 Tax=Clonostachys rhizophaga TaxID=160324 RepID=A0A9N9W3Y2_9HYPO|nr:unnamed protein product [Clonostachys rhizophaga]
MRPTNQVPEFIQMLPQDPHLQETEGDSKTPSMEKEQPTTFHTVYTKPQRLRRFEYLPLAGHIFLAIFPILFIALAATAIALDKKETSHAGKVVQQIITASPTLFPIIFAGIVGHFFRALGLYWAERGIKIGVLERLIGSQSLFATLERQILLQDQYALGLAMILVWALSPLGGQAALRLLSIVPRKETIDATIRYLPIAAARESAMLGASTMTSTWPIFASLFMTGLTTSKLQQNETMDLFGNVRVPVVASGAEENVWSTIDRGQQVSYSSMLGIPVVGVPASGNTSFNMVSRYFGIDCTQSSVLVNATVFKNNSDGVGAGYSVYSKGANFVVQPTRPTGTLLVTDNSIDFNVTAMNSDDSSDCSFLKCSLKGQYVESSVSCINRACQVESLRKVAADQDSFVPYSAVSNALVFLPLITVGSISHGSRMSSSLVEKWLEKPYTNVYGEGTYSFANLSALPLPTLSRNLEVLFNTYWQSTYGQEYVYGNLTADMSLYNNITNAVPNFAPTDFNTTETTITHQVGEEYKCNMTFAALLILISCILFFAAVSSISLMFNTLAPDILGYVSSFTRDNPYIRATEQQASHWDGLERSRAMRNVKVTLGDVRSDLDTGYIALAESQEVQRLKMDRLYH